jgi:hypothetical protein
MDTTRIDRGESLLEAHHRQAAMPGTVQEQGHTRLLFLSFVAL